MGEKTDIEWCDSTLNLMMGCDGCELRAGTVNTCYAGQIVDKMVSSPKGPPKGWPLAFDKPLIFAERILLLDKWKDLTGTDRPEKPWLNGLPRVIFLNDMGDTFTESLPINWLWPFMEHIAGCPHILLLLTKRPKRMAEFFGKYVGCPPNVWPGTSITGPENMSRVADLVTIKSRRLWVSAEPLLSPINLPTKNMETPSLNWVIVGGESGQGARPTNIEHIRHVVQQGKSANVPVFVKQLGSNAVDQQSDMPEAPPYEYLFNSRKGGDMQEWPEDLRVREFPH